MKRFSIFNTAGKVIIDLVFSVEHYHGYKINIENYNNFIVDSVKINRCIKLITKNIENITKLTGKYFNDEVHDILVCLCEDIGLNLIEILDSDGGSL